MQVVDLTDADEVCRCIIFDRAFQANLHVDEFLWRFGQTKDDGAAHESAVLRRFAPEADDVHRIGCSIAAAQNVRAGEPESGIKRRYYCGFRSATYASLPKEGDGYQIQITHSPEGGEEAHLDVALIYLVEGRSARANCRTEAGLALAEQFGPPAPHRCKTDESDDQHPFSLLGERCLTSGLRDRWDRLILDDYLDDESQDDQDGQLAPRLDL